MRGHYKLISRLIITINIKDDENGWSKSVRMLWRCMRKPFHANEIHMEILSKWFCVIFYEFFMSGLTKRWNFVACMLTYIHSMLWLRLPNNDRARNELYSRLVKMLGMGIGCDMGSTVNMQDLFYEKKRWEINWTSINFVGTIPLNWTEADSL